MAFPTPISEFSFDEGSGSTAQSGVGGYSLTANNPATAWGAGTSKSGAAGRFTGAIGASLSTWSLQFDMYISSINDWSSIIEGDGVYFEFDSSGAFDAFLGGDDGGVYGTALATDTWYNITVTHDDASNTSILYTNTSLTTTKVHSASTGATNFGASMSVCGSLDQPFDGRVDNIRVWNVVLSAQEVSDAAAYPASLPGTMKVWNGSSWGNMQPRIWNGTAWVVQAATLLNPGSGGGGSTIAYPLLAGMLIGDPHNYQDTTYQQQIAKLDLAILGIYDGWSGNGSGVTPSQAVSAIKAYNPNILLGNYTIMTEVPTSSSDTATQDLRAKLSSEQGPNGIGDWWAYDSAGNHTDWSGGTYPVWDTNLTLQTTPDGNGDRWPQWLAKRDNTKLLSSADWDIWYSDNNFWQPRIDDDWNRDGSNDSASTIAVRNWWRDGQRAYYDTAKSLQPNLVLIGNIDNDLDGSTYPAGADSFTQYKDVFGGGFMEHVIGEDWSPEAWGGWSMAMGWYHKAISNMVAPNYCIFDVYMSDTTDYQTLRYALGSSLLDNGYFSASSDYTTVLWYDEFDLAGTADTGWLGAPTDGPQLSEWSNGVYRRRFANGMVLVNPKGNGQKTVTVGAGYHRINGTQDPTTNNGQAVTSTVTLQDRDALILVKS